MWVLDLTYSNIFRRRQRSLISIKIFLSTNPTIAFFIFWQNFLRSIIYIDQIQAIKIGELFTPTQFYRKSYTISLETAPTQKICLVRNMSSFNRNTTSGNKSFADLQIRKPTLVYLHPTISSLEKFLTFHSRVQWYLNFLIFSRHFILSPAANVEQLPIDKCENLIN